MGRKRQLAEGNWKMMQAQRAAVHPARSPWVLCANLGQWVDPEGRSGSGFGGSSCVVLPERPGRWLPQLLYLQGPPSNPYLHDFHSSESAWSLGNRLHRQAVYSMFVKTLTTKSRKQSPKGGLNSPLRRNCFFVSEKSTLIHLWLERQRQGHVLERGQKGEGGGAKELCKC